MPQQLNKAVILWNDGIKSLLIFRGKIVSDGTIFKVGAHVISCKYFKSFESYTDPIDLPNGFIITKTEVEEITERKGK